MTKKKHSFKKTDPFAKREADKYENPVPSREYILEVIESRDKPMMRRDLQKLFGLRDEFQKEAFRRRLRAMVRDEQLLRTSQGYMVVFAPMDYRGTLSLEKDGNGFLLTEDGQSVRLWPRETRCLCEGDELTVTANRYDYDGNLVGTVTKVHQLAIPRVMGKLMKHKSAFYVVPQGKADWETITVSTECASNAKDGDIVVAEILRDKKNYRNMPLSGKVVEVLGDPKTPGIEVEMAIHKFELPHLWSEAVQKACKKYGESIPKQALKERVDCRELPFVTIDGEDAKDFDDAVFCEPRDKGGWRLYVAIADVSYYVKPNTALDKEANLRGNSAYFPGSVVPMLPEVLSNGLCSLNPHVERLCMVCEMTVDKKGKVTRSAFYEGVMISKARMTYTDVAALLGGNKELREKYDEIVPDLESLQMLYQAFSKQRHQRGAIEFESIETKVMFGEKGKIAQIVPVARNVAHCMIEECMLAANVCAAKFLQKSKQPALYRVHEPPPAEKLTSLRIFLSELGLNLSGGKKPTAKDYGKLLDKVVEREDAHLIHMVMLRSMSQAVYAPKNEGHFGLAYPAYLHFTSPIRRYPDLLVHRAIKGVLNDKPLSEDEAFTDKLEVLGNHFSYTERRADDASRDAMLGLKCEYMQSKIGQKFKGMISSVTSFGLFIELKDIYVEGLIHISQLGTDYYYFEPEHHRLVGEHTGETFQLGGSLTVRVVRVDVDERKIDFELIGSKNRKKRKKRRRHHDEHEDYNDYDEDDDWLY